MLWLLALLLAPVLAATACLLWRDDATRGRLATIGGALTLAASLAFAYRIVAGGAFSAFAGWLHGDALAALVAVVCGVAAFTTAVHGHDYMIAVRGLEPSDAGWAPGRWDALGFGLVACSLLAAVADHLGLMWIALEGATLSSALMVGYYRRADALEAAWKYLILCSVGLALALLATVLFYYSGVLLVGEGDASLNLTRLLQLAAGLDARYVKLAFLFALVGYGTKAGLAPMHAWVPDAYSRAPAPASALLATALSASAIAALLRVTALTRAVVGPVWPDHLLALFGVGAMVLAVPFLIVQGELKRLLAWSCVQHTGLVLLAVSLGTPLATFGALLHLLVQSWGKALAFLVGGTLLRATGSRRIDHCTGILASDRGLGTLLLIAGLAVTGLPPAATFTSEWLALAGGFSGPRPTLAVIALCALAAGFIGIAFHWTHMLMGARRESFADPLPTSSRRPLWLLATLLVTLGLWLPAPVRALVEQAIQVVHP
jgi:hydrogenase-4 component F